MTNKLCMWQRFKKELRYAKKWVAVRSKCDTKDVVTISNNLFKFIVIEGHEKKVSCMSDELRTAVEQVVETMSSSILEDAIKIMETKGNKMALDARDDLQKMLEEIDLIEEL